MEPDITDNSRSAMPKEPAARFVAFGGLVIALCILWVELTIGTHLEPPVFAFMLLAVLMSFFVLPFSLLCFWRKYWRVGSFGFAMSILATVWFGIGLFLPGDGRIIGRTTTPDGSEMCVVQFNPGGLSDQRFWYRPADGPWRQYYLDHDAFKWWGGGIHLTGDGKRAVIRRFIFATAIFDLTSGLLTVKSNGLPSADFPPMPAECTPETFLAKRAWLRRNRGGKYPGPDCGD